MLYAVLRGTDRNSLTAQPGQEMLLTRTPESPWCRKDVSTFVRLQLEEAVIVPSCESLELDELPFSLFLDVVSLFQRKVCPDVLICVVPARFSVFSSSDRAWYTFHTVIIAAQYAFTTTVPTYCCGIPAGVRFDGEGTRMVGW